MPLALWKWPVGVLILASGATALAACSSSPSPPNSSPTTTTTSAATTSTTARTTSSRPQTSGTLVPQTRPAPSSFALEEHQLRDRRQLRPECHHVHAVPHDSPPKSVTLGADGTLTECTGVTCLSNAGENTPTLAYGMSITLEPFTCSSSTAGIKCTLADGDGFLIRAARSPHWETPRWPPARAEPGRTFSAFLRQVWNRVRSSAVLWLPGGEVERVAVAMSSSGAAPC